jgi:hypothetical protein
MIDRKRLLDDLRKLVTKLEKDLRERCEENAEVDARVRLEYDQAKEAKRTAQAYKIWRDEWITQVAVAWVLGAVFVRFIEDNELIATPFIAGPGQRLDFAKEQRTAFFTQNPTLSDREYLEHVFREVAKLPAMKELYDERHNPLWALGVSGDGAKLILEQFQKTDVATAALVHDFTDPSWETRFLGDLYQDLSETARKKYALLQTPDFVEEFILDRTLDPAIAEFGLAEVRMIDPTCGSGHFLLGAFARIFRLWEAREPATNPIVLAQRALDSVFGVDLNPFAVAISRFRLLVAAMQASGVKRLVDAPAFAIHIAVGDSLLHGPRFSATAGVQRHLDAAEDPLRHVYATEDADALRQILGQQYHAVVGNPPYITVKDKALNEGYRQKYGSCSGKYSLSVPFMERFFELAVPKTDVQAAGFVGQITANSFMKREFGAKLIERFVPAWDLTHVIDASGAFIPGHGTPTVILFGRNQMPTGDHVRAVMGIRGEPSTPDDPAEGLVWTAITGQVDQSGSVSDWVSVADVPRSGFHKHPWSMGGGGAAELKDYIEQSAARRLGDMAESIGFASFTGQDDAFVADAGALRRFGIPATLIKPFIQGDAVRDWTVSSDEAAFVPYDQSFEPVSLDRTSRWCRRMWPYRASIEGGLSFGGETRKEQGDDWWTWYRWIPSKYRIPLSITYAEVATHNHFVLDRGGKAFKQTAPVIKLSPAATTDDHLTLLGILNSSTACFWLKQVSHRKSHSTQKHHPDPARTAYSFSGSVIEKLPVPDARTLVGVNPVAGLLDRLALQRAEVLSIEFLKNRLGDDSLQQAIEERWHTADLLRERMVALQEELDWRVYAAFGLAGADLIIDDNLLPELSCPRGQRPFEQLHGRRSLVRRGGAAVDLAEAEIGPASTLATACEMMWARRRDAVERDGTLALIETAESKRLWRDTDANVPEPAFRESYDRQQLRELLLARIEDVVARESILTPSRVAIHVQSDSEFISTAQAYRRSLDFDFATIVSELVESDAVPVLPMDRYSESGLRNRKAWEETWALQRREDLGEHVGPIPVSPKYQSSDFRSSTYWSLRGKLDVPKERFISFPGCERESDSSLPILWAGYDHLQQAKAIAAYYQDLKEKEGAGPAKLGKLLACILELLPWLKQWHNDVDPEYGTRMGDFFETFMLSEMSSLGLSMDELRKIRGL